MVSVTETSKPNRLRTSTGVSGPFFVGRNHGNERHRAASLDQDVERACLGVAALGEDNLHAIGRKRDLSFDRRPPAAYSDATPATECVAARG